MRLIKNQLVPAKVSNSFSQIVALTRSIAVMDCINEVTGLGDCYEVEFNPVSVQERLYKQLPDIRICIRQVELNKWRVWRVK